MTSRAIGPFDVKLAPLVACNGPYSRTDQLVGLAGSISIIIASDGKHSYEFDHTLPASR